MASFEDSDDDIHDLAHNALSQSRSLNVLRYLGPLTSLRSLPHVERVSKLSIDRRHKADPPGPERPESQL